MEENNSPVQYVLPFLADRTNIHYLCVSHAQQNVNGTNE
jgi:hypothetical protein